MIQIKKTAPKAEAVDGLSLNTILADHGLKSKAKTETPEAEDVSLANILAAHAFPSKNKLKKRDKKRLDKIKPVATKPQVEEVKQAANKL